MPKTHSLRYSAALGAIVVLIALAGCAGSSSSGSSNTNNGTVGKVSSLTVTDQVSTSGTLSADQLSELTWGTTGVVDTISVKTGAQVKTGDILAALKSDSVPASVITAQADLAAAQQALDDLLTSGTPAAQAQLALANAQTALTDAQNKVDSYKFTRASSAQIQNAQANLVLAQNQETEARRVWQNFKNKPADSAGRAQAYTAYYSATQAVAKAQSNLNWLTGGPSQQDVDLANANLAVAQAAFDDAQRAWDRLKNGPDAVQLADAKAKVATAQAAVNSMYILAPFDGQVLAVETAPGNPVNSGDAAIVMVNPKTLKVAAGVDETEISQVKVGDTAEITSDAMPGAKLTGTVALVDPIGQTSNGIVTYTVYVSIDPTDQPVLYGATADVTLQTSQPRTMLAVPLGAVQNDNQGEYVLLYSSDGSTQRVDVKSDTVSNGLVTITGNLKEGDQVFVGTVSTTNNNSGGGFFGGGGGAVVRTGP
jgi:HlyD family secretion protein